VNKRPKASVVVPAHQEESGLARCLQAVLHDGEPLEVIVAVNGSSDRTADIARQFPVVLLELPAPGKAPALDAADAVCTVLPRLYVDADVVLEPGAVAALVKALDVPHARLATPRRRLDLTGASPLVRLYYRTWQRLQEVRGDLLGCGVYAVNAAGRERWDRFPPGIADDYHVHTRFSAGERVLVADAVSVVRPPRTFASLISVRARVYAGNVEHAARHGVMKRPEPRREALMRDPVALAGLPLYVLVTALAKRRARQRVAAGSTDWARDASGRAA
jgi:glycosyltransferase involved in cell wall biosynthesis